MSKITFTSPDSVMPDVSLSRQVELIVELEKNFNEAVSGVVDVEEIRSKIGRTDREAPRQTPEMVFLSAINSK